jgi:hypothetical protein
MTRSKLVVGREWKKALAFVQTSALNPKPTNLVVTYFPCLSAHTEHQILTEWVTKFETRH